MNMEPVNSSWISEIGHDAGTKTLRVKLKGGRVYEYSGVSAETHSELMSSKGIGSHLSSRIVPHHEAVRIDG